MTATALSSRLSDPAAAPSRRFGLELGSDMSFDDWALVGARIASICGRGGVGGALGDWLLFGERRFGERYRSALDATNLDYQTLRNYAWVARSFAPTRRREHLSFQHHAEVAALPAAEQDLWLHRAEAQGWSRNQLLRRRLAAQRLKRRPDALLPAVVVRVEVPSDRAERVAQRGGRRPSRASPSGCAKSPTPRPRSPPARSQTLRSGRARARRRSCRSTRSSARGPVPRRSRRGDLRFSWATRKRRGGGEVGDGLTLVAAVHAAQADRGGRRRRARPSGSLPRSRPRTSRTRGVARGHPTARRTTS